MRLETAIKNIKYSAITYILTYILKFAVRFAFIKNLSIEILGINGLFGNILAMLSFAEMGIGPAIVYSLYKPLAEKDFKTVKSLMDLFKKAYCSIGCIIFVLGILILPWINIFIKNDAEIEHLKIYYLIFLVNTSISYFYSYKASLLQADQKQYICSYYHGVFQIVLSIIQIVLLVVFQNYVLYILSMCIFTFLENYYLAKKVDLLYPFLKLKNSETLDMAIKDNIIQNVKAMVIHRFSNTISYYSGNVIISKIIGLAEVGLYSNYVLGITVLESLAAQMVSATTATIGNMVVIDDDNKKVKIFKVMEFVVAWEAMLMSVGIFILLDDFILLWLGKEYVFAKYITLSLAVSFYFRFMRRAILVFRDAYGLYWQDRYKSVAEMFINIGLSTYLTINYGIIGVIWGGIISNLLTNFWIEPYVLFKNGLKIKFRDYLKRYFCFGLVTTIIYIILLFVKINIIAGGFDLMLFAVNTLLLLVISNFIWVLSFRNLGEFNYLFSLVKIKICSR